MTRYLRSLAVCSAALLSVVLFGAAPALSDPSDCFQFPDRARRILGCTAVILAGENVENVARAYSNRGLALLEMEEFDKAIADYNEAIKRDPRSASDYVHRG